MREEQRHLGLVSVRCQTNRDDVEPPSSTTVQSAADLAVQEEHSTLVLSTQEEGRAAVTCLEELVQEVLRAGGADIGSRVFLDASREVTLQ